MPTFGDLYGDLMDRELATEDRTQRMTIDRRKAVINEGQRVFVEQTSCFTKRASLSLSDETGEYDLITLVPDFWWPSKTGVTIQVDGATTTTYLEGERELAYVSEEELNQTRPGWRGVDAAFPRCWYLRGEGAAKYLGLHPAPRVNDGETWTLRLPYIAMPAELTDDDALPFAGRTDLMPYHLGVLHYGAAQLEKLRKNWEGVQRQMQLFGAVVAKYRQDRMPLRGSRVRLAVNYRTRTRGGLVRIGPELGGSFDSGAFD